MVLSGGLESLGCRLMNCFNQVGEAFAPEESCVDFEYF